MAKSKNHSSHHVARKNHRNGIKKPKKIQQESFKMMNPKWVKAERVIRKKIQAENIRKKQLKQRKPETPYNDRFKKAEPKKVEPKKAGEPKKVEPKKAGEPKKASESKPKVAAPQKA